MALTEGLKDEFKAKTEESAELFTFQRELLEAGFKSGSVDGYMKTAAAAAKEAQNSLADVAEKQAQQRADDMFFLALLENGDLDTYVAENIFGGMSDAEISATVERIEAETGKSFDEYAKEILGDDMPERMPGESDADYHRRVLIAVADEVLEDDLTIKPGYENDPIAKIVKGDQTYTDIKARVEDLKQAREAGATIDQLAVDLDNLTSSSSAADILANEMDGDEEIVALARAEHNEDIAQANSVAETSTSNLMLSGDLLSGDLVGGLGLEQAPPIGDQFASANNEGLDKVLPDQELQIPTIKLES